MLKINPKFLYDKNKNKVGVFLSARDFDILVEKIEDLEDLIELREITEEEQGQESTSADDFYLELGYSEEEIKEIKDSAMEIYKENNEGLEKIPTSSV